MSHEIQAGFSDAAARERIRTSLNESLFVEAAAGTGKTTELVERLVAILEHGHAVPSGLIAVTFTRKAAGELKLRLRQALDSRLKRLRETLRSVVVSDSESALAKLAHIEEAISHLEEARIGTIHALCAELLRERPVEAGIDPGFEEVADDEAPRIYRKAFDSWIQEQLEDLSPGIRRALTRLSLESRGLGHGPLDRLRDAGWSLVEWRDFPTAWRRDAFDREAEVTELVAKVERLDELLRSSTSPRDELRMALAPVQSLAGWLERMTATGAELDLDALEARLMRLHMQVVRGTTFAWHDIP